MATYVPGSETYGREFQAFTPDYKFLSNVLQTRQDRYDTNYKQLNDLYSKVVYADLSRQDTTDMRNQYAETLSPKIQQISGMDLSLQQNVDAARAVFQPFYENDLIVKDLVYTKAYNQKLQQAENIRKNAPEKYSTEGIERMRYEMEDFKNADKNTALAQALPTYSENVDLMTLANEILEEAGFEDVTIDIPPGADDLFIITEKNGAQMVPQAYEVLQSRMLKDPRVIEMYKTRTFVEARRFAEENIANGNYSSIPEAQNAWADEKISDVAQRNMLNNAALTKQLQEATRRKANWEAYAKKRGGKLNAKDQQTLLESVEFVDQLQGALKRNEETLAKLNNLRASDDLLSEATKLLMNYNLSTDILAAAENYSMRDYSRTIKANPFKKMELEFEMKKRLAKYKQDLEDGEDVEPPAFPLFPEIGGVRADATLQVEDTDAVRRNRMDLSRYFNRTLEDKIEFIISMDQLSKANSNTDSSELGRMSVELIGSNGIEEEYQGSYDNVRRKLNKKDGLGRLQNQIYIDKAYEDAIKEFETLRQNNPEAYGNTQLYPKLSELYQDIVTEQKFHLAALQKHNHILNNNWEIIKAVPGLVSGEWVELVKKFENGLPQIMEEGVDLDADGNPDKIRALMGREDYAELYRTAVEDGKLEALGITTDSYRETTYRTEYVDGVTVRMATGLSDYMPEKAYEAGLNYYDAQKAALNATLNDAINTKAGGGNLITTPFSVDAFFRRKKGEEHNWADLRTYQSYMSTYNFNELMDKNKNLTEKGEKFLEIWEPMIQVYQNPNKIFIPSGGSTKGEEEFENVLSEDGEKMRKNAEMLFNEVFREIQKSITNQGDASKELNNLVVPVAHAPVKMVDGKAFAAYSIGVSLDLRRDFTDTKGEIDRKDRDLYSSVTMLVPLDEDPSPRAAGNYMSSSVDSEIFLSREDRYDFNDYKDVAGSFSIQKENNDYYVILDIKHYDQKNDEFVSDENPQRVPLMLQGQKATLQNVDAMADAMRQKLRVVYQQNIQASNNK